MEATCSFENLAPIYQITRYNIPEDICKTAVFNKIIQLNQMLAKSKKKLSNPLKHKEEEEGE